MPTLSSYLTALQRLLGTGSAGNIWTTAQLTDYINQARHHVAQDAECIRALPPIQGSITSITVLSGGTGWSNINPPTVVITTPDSPSGVLPNPNGSPATAVATTSGGAVTLITITSAGAGYFQPAVSLTSGAGTGTTLSTLVSGVNVTAQGQEVYPLQNITALVSSSTTGISTVFAVNSISLLWGTFRYTLMRKSFSEYQAKVRTYTVGYQYIPAVWSMFGQGETGSVYMFPIPNTSYQMEWDCLATPNDLALDTDVDALPGPYSDAVKYYAAYLAYQQVQRFADADRMYSLDEARAPGLYQRALSRARKVSMPRFSTNPYGRG